MASPIRTTGFLLHLDKSEFVETWIKYLVPHVRGKKLKDKKEYEGDNEMIGVFSFWLQTVWTYPRELKELVFHQTKKNIRKDIRPKMRLVIVEETKFMTLKKEISIYFLYQQRDDRRKGEFEKKKCLLKIN